MFRASDGGSGGAYGVVVPEGDPGALHDAAAAMTSIAGVLEHVGGEPAKGTPADWHGQAAMNFSNACATEGAVATRGAGAMDVAAHALHGLARDLAEAQKACRRQLGLAREAKERGDRARLAAQQASECANAARLSAAAAAKRASMAELGGLPSGPERSAQAQSTSTASAADLDFQAHTRSARTADEHLHDAQESARKKVEWYENSARHTAGILSGLAAQAPTVAAVNGHPVAATGGPGRPPGIIPVAVKPPQPVKKEDDDNGGGILGAIKDFGDDVKRAYGTVSTVGHTALDGAGVIPAFGDVLADGTNALWYLAEGNKGDAAFSAGAMLPIAGTASTIAKRGKHALDATKGAEKIADGARDAEGVAHAARDLSRARHLIGKPGDTIVLGRQPDTAIAKQWPDHVILNDPNWTMELNDAFIEAAISERRRIYIASPINEENLIQRVGEHAGEESVFARELTQLDAAGYRLNGDYMEPPQ